jgi:NDP-sugar pyrophosphorylase family protein
VLPVVILAGGLGTRMRPATDELPKALLPVAGRAFAEIQLEWLIGEGVDRLIYCIGYRGERIKETLGDGQRFGVRIEYVDEGDELRGTAGAVRLALDEGKLPDAFFVLNGDSYLSVTLGDVERAWRASNAPALMTVFKNDGRWDRSNAVVREGRVLYDKHNPTLGEGPVQWIDYGLCILQRFLIEDEIPSGQPADLADLMHRLSVRGSVAAYEAQRRFYEVGSPNGLRDLQSHLLEAG